jgi:hypothetical protein
MSWPRSPATASPSLLDAVEIDALEGLDDGR